MKIESKPIKTPIIIRESFQSFVFVSEHFIIIIIIIVRATVFASVTAEVRKHIVKQVKQIFVARMFACLAVTVYIYIYIYVCV